MDGQSSLKSLSENQALLHHGISLEVGSSKNKNSNSVIDKACRELRDEIRKLNPSGGPISNRTLAIATENLNNRLRANNRSALEIWMSRDKSSGDNLALNDQDLAKAQHERRKQSQKSSAKYEARGAPQTEIPEIKAGMLVYIKSDKSKSNVRPPYAVLAVDNN